MRSVVNPAGHRAALAPDRPGAGAAAVAAASARRGLRWRSLRVGSAGAHGPWLTRQHSVGAHHRGGCRSGRETGESFAGAPSRCLCQSDADRFPVPLAGELIRDSEVQVKTSKTRLEPLRQALMQLTATTPEWISWPVETSPAYGSWALDAVSSDVLPPAASATPENGPPAG